MQVRPRGGKNNYHSKEEKIKIVKEMLDFNLSPLYIEKKYNISHSLAGKWRKDYLERGETSLVNKKSLEIQYVNFQIRRI
ncbi:MAG: hypothetical protein J6A52_02410 [Bacilli bacterium]|nr:hypothetical protein [Bacilli bacterium]